ncbi:5'/3'-nucleotidase SurE [Spirillospora sp. NPDC052242]
MGDPHSRRRRPTKKTLITLSLAGHDVTIVAPADDQSGKGTGRAFGGTVEAAHVSADVWSVTGTPGDAVVGADGTTPAARWTLTDQDRQPLITPSYTDRGDGTYTMELALDAREPGRRSDVAALAADRISITPIEANWGAGPLARARAGALLRGLQP